MGSTFRYALVSSRYPSLEAMRHLHATIRFSPEAREDAVALFAHLLPMIQTKARKRLRFGLQIAAADFVSKLIKLHILKVEPIDSFSNLLWQKIAYFCSAVVSTFRALRT